MHPAAATESRSPPVPSGHARGRELGRQERDLPGSLSGTGFNKLTLDDLYVWGCFAIGDL